MTWSMLRVAGVVLVCASGCASVVGPLVAHEDATDKHNNQPSRFSRCGTGGFIVGALIDSVVIAGDLLISEEYNYIDGLVIAPFALDILIGAGFQGNCGD